MGRIFIAKEYNKKFTFINLNVIDNEYNNIMVRKEFLLITNIIIQCYFFLLFFKHQRGENLLNEYNKKKLLCH